MNKINFLLYAFIIFVSASCSQNSINENTEQLFIIPQSENSVLAKMKGDTVINIREINIEYDSKSIVTDNNLIVSISKESKTLTIHNLSGELLHEKKDVNYKSINHKKNIIYLGGESNDEFRHEISNEGEIFSILNLNNSKYKIKNISLPIKVMYGKSIDDILILNNGLILVDNEVYPKYIIKYNIENPKYPQHILTEELANNGTYEHIIKGAANKDWLVLLSSTVGGGGTGDYLTISGKKEGYLSVQRSWNFQNEIQVEEYRCLKDFCLINNFLFVLECKKLYYLNLNGKISMEELTPIETKMNPIEKLLKTENDKLLVVDKNSYEIINLKEILQEKGP